MIIDQWEERDESKCEYSGLQEMKENYRRPAFGFMACSPSMKRVYVVEIGDLLKIGITANPRHRIMSLQKHGKIGKIFIAQHGSMFYAEERAIHKRLSYYKVHGEFFRLQYWQVVGMIKTRMPHLLKR
jgi:hypothetical protein